jgi:integrase
MASAWIYQDLHMVQKHGEDRASWYVGWLEPDGRRKCKSCGPGSFGKVKAQKLRRKIESELMTGTYQMQTNKLWEEFRREYEARVVGGKPLGTRRQVKAALDHFERLVKPVRVFALCTAHIDEFIAKRRQEAGKKRRSLLSPYSLNSTLRQLRAAVAVAVEWGYLARMPKFRLEREPGKLPTYVTGDHFAAIYRACVQARKPRDLPNVTAAAWWQALLVTGYMTGWRIGDLLGLQREDLDLKAETAISRAKNNKGKRDELVKLHPVVVEHLKQLEGSFSPVVFPWNESEQSLYRQFRRIQEAAGIKLPCSEEHEHTPCCYVYGFHDLRRAFATMNADRLTADALQVLMRHKSYQTTQRYINMARQMDAAVASLHVPEVLRSQTGT